MKDALLRRLSALAYITTRGARGMAQSPLVQLIAVGTMAVCMLMLGTVTLVFSNAQAVTQEWGVDVPMTVYMVEGVEPEETRAIAPTHRGDRQCRTRRAHHPRKWPSNASSKAWAATAELSRASMPRPCPDSIEVHLQEGTDASFAPRLADKLEAFEEVEEVALLGAWVEQAEQMLDTLRLLAAGIGLLVGMACMAIVWSTIRLGVFARRSELEILRLVGGTHSFVRGPFVVEGMIQGVVGTRSRGRHLVGSPSTSCAPSSKRACRWSLPRAPFTSSRPYRFCVRWPLARPSASRARARRWLATPRFEGSMAVRRSKRGRFAGLAFGLCAFALCVVPESAAAPRKAGQGEVETQLALTRAAAELGSARASLERERETLAYAETLLGHRGKESLRRLSSYRAARGAREGQARKRARVLYKLARGGLPRLYFDKLNAAAEGDKNADRITRGRSVRWLVRHDLRELEVHRRAESGASAELLAASREFAAISALRMVQGMQVEATEAFEAQLTPQLLASVAANKRRAKKGKLGAAKPSARGRAPKKEFRALQRQRGFDLLEPRSLPRPVNGRIVGRFGKHVDRKLRIEFERKGIELQANAGRSVKSIAAGTVAFVGALPGFDQVVVIDHGGGYLTLTGRLLDLSVAEGDAVEAGQAHRPRGSRRAGAGPGQYRVPRAAPRRTSDRSDPLPSTPRWVDSGHACFTHARGLSALSRDRLWRWSRHQPGPSFRPRQG